jgi:hypothetical protein
MISTNFAQTSCSMCHMLQYLSFILAVQTVKLFDPYSFGTSNLFPPVQYHIKYFICCVYARHS